MRKIVLLLFCVPLAILTQAQDTARAIANVEFISDDLSGIINRNARVEILADGFQFTEGPLWLAKQNMLLFSDVPANTVYKWTQAKGKEVYLKPGGYTGTEARGGFLGPNGLLLTPAGKLWVCQHGDRRIAEMNASLNEPKVAFNTIAAEYNGKKFNSPNDLLLTEKGDLYFTDPNYGLARGPADPKREIPFQGLYKMDKSGRVSLLVDSIEQPNGLGFLPGGKTMIVSNSDNVKKRWYAYDVATDGTLSGGRIFYDVSGERGLGGCDGLKIDKAGNIFATGPGGIWIFNKTGKLLGKIKVAGLSAANCALTPDGKTLFVTATTHLLRLKMR